MKRLYVTHDLSEIALAFFALSVGVGELLVARHFGDIHWWFSLWFFGNAALLCFAVCAFCLFGMDGSSKRRDAAETAKAGG